MKMLPVATQLPRIVVCAAIRHKTTGMIISGPRHGHCFNSAIRCGSGIDHSPSGDMWVCGFVDQHNQFMTREEAWIVADKAGQIRRPTGLECNFDNHRKAGVGDIGLLFSENLY